MTLISTAKLAELSGLRKRQVQRILERGTPDLGATRAPGGHWVIPDTPKVRRWAKNYQRWQRGGSAKASKMDAPGKFKGLITIEGIAMSFTLWHRKMADIIPQWDDDQMRHFLKIVEPMEQFHARMIELRERLER